MKELNSPSIIHSPAERPSYFAFSCILSRHWVLLMKKHSIKPVFVRNCLPTGLGLVCEMGKELAPRSRLERGGRWFSLRLAACHKWGPPGIDPGPHTVQHLPKCSGRWHWEHHHHVCFNAASTKTDQILGGIRRDLTREIRDVIIPRYQALGRPRLEYCVQFWSPQFKKRHTQTEEGLKGSHENNGEPVLQGGWRS